MSLAAVSPLPASSSSSPTSSSPSSSSSPASMLEAPGSSGGSTGVPTSPVPVQRKLPSMSLRKSQQQQSPSPTIKKEASPPVLSPQGAQQLATAAMATLLPQPAPPGGLLVPGANAVPLPGPGSRAPPPPVSKESMVDKRMQQELLRRQQQDELRLQQMRKQAFDETLSRTGHYVAPVSYHHNFVIPALPNFDEASAIAGAVATSTSTSTVSSSSMSLEYSTGEAI